MNDELHNVISKLDEHPVPSRFVGLILINALNSISEKSSLEKEIISAISNGTSVDIEYIRRSTAGSYFDSPRGRLFRSAVDMNTDLDGYYFEYIIKWMSELNIDISYIMDNLKKYMNC